MAAKEPACPVVRLGRETVAVEGAAGPWLEVRYRGADVYKPYVRGVWTRPGGVNPFRDSPPDHKHHRALMLAWNVDGVEFWAEGPGVGRLVHRAFGGFGVEPGEARLAETIDWTAPDGRRLLEEVRRLRVGPDPETGGMLLDWRSVFRVPLGRLRATVTGRAYHGLGIRFQPAWDRTARFLTPRGTAGVDGTNEKSFPWCAVLAGTEAGSQTVAVLAHPSNPRPADWFTMVEPFTYISATLAVDARPLEVEPDRPLQIRYAVLVAEGESEPKRIDRLWKEWAKRSI